MAPFGGIKQSGLGREGSKYGIEEYIEVGSLLNFVFIMLSYFSHILITWRWIDAVEIYMSWKHKEVSL